MAARASIISPQQCKRARAMLKWNIQDLASHTTIPLKQIEKFERNQIRLTKPENDEVLSTFTKQNLILLNTGEVERRITHGSQHTDSHHIDTDGAPVESTPTSFHHTTPAAPLDIQLSRSSVTEKRVYRGSTPATEAE